MVGNYTPRSASDTPGSIPDPLIEDLDFIGGSAKVLHESCPSIDRPDAVLFESAELLRLAHPWTCVDLRVGDGHRKLENVEGGSAIALLEDHVNTVGIAEMIDPSPFVDASGCNYERVAVPTAGRVTPPSWLVRIHQRFAPVRPDRARSVAPLELLQDFVGQDVHFHRIGINESPRRTHGVAVLVGVGAVGWGNGAAAPAVFFRMCRGIGAAQISPIGCLVTIEHFLPERRERRA